MISNDDIKHLAKLSRIEITEEETEKMTSEIDSILGYVGQINNVSAEEKREVPVHRNVMREDETTHEPDEFTEKLLSNAPQREGRYLKVKKIL